MKYVHLHSRRWSPPRVGESDPAAWKQLFSFRGAMESMARFASRAGFRSRFRRARPQITRCFAIPLRCIAWPSARIAPSGRRHPVATKRLALGQYHPDFMARGASWGEWRDTKAAAPVTQTHMHTLLVLLDERSDGVPCLCAEMPRLRATTRIPLKRSPTKTKDDIECCLPR